MAWQSRWLKAGLQREAVLFSSALGWLRSPRRADIVGRSVAEFADGFDSFRARFGNEDDGAAFVTEGRAHLIGEIFFVLLGKEFFAIDE